MWFRKLASCFLLSIVAFISLVMYSFLPLGIFGNKLDFTHMMGLKVGIAIAVAIFSALFYLVFYKTRKVRFEFFGFGLMISIIIPGFIAFCTTDIILKLFKIG